MADCESRSDGSLLTNNEAGPDGEANSAMPAVSGLKSGAPASISASNPLLLDLSPAAAITSEWLRAEHSDELADSSLSIIVTDVKGKDLVPLAVAGELAGFEVEGTAEDSDRCCEVTGGTSALSSGDTSGVHESHSVKSTDWYGVNFQMLHGARSQLPYKGCSASQLSRPGLQLQLKQNPAEIQQT